MKRLLGACAALLLAACGGQESAPETGSGALFVDVTAEAGLDFEHFIGASGEWYLVEIMGSGAALFDFDGDGDLDVFLAQGELLALPGTSPEPSFAPPAAGYPGSRLFRNDSADGVLRFVDVTEPAGIAETSYALGAAVGDYDGDGDLDLYVTAFGPNTLWRNEGGGRLTEVTAAAGVEDERWSASASWLDYDADGDLDLFVTNYVDFVLRNNKECFSGTGERDYCTPNAYRSVPDRLFRNEGGGKFRDVTADAGIGQAYGNGLGVSTADFNGDGYIDIYVANDGTANQYWINQGDGTFVDDALMAGSAYNADGEAEAGMGVTAGDFDEDGDEDLFVTHLTLESNTLYLNNGRGVFRDATTQAGLGSASVAFTGFGSSWFDYDNDGALDVFIANGAVTSMEPQRGEAFPFRQTNQLFHRENGAFRDVSAEAGEAFAMEDVSRGAAFGDVDGDGDVDVLVSNNNGAARLLRNDAGQSNGWLAVRLAGTASNREGLGARVALLRDGEAIRWRRVHRDGSYLSASDAEVIFGLGGETAEWAVGAVWPGGAREMWTGLAARQRHVLAEGEGQPWP